MKYASVHKKFMHWMNLITNYSVRNVTYQTKMFVYLYKKGVIPTFVMRYITVFVYLMYIRIIRQLAGICKHYLKISSNVCKR